MAKSQLRLKAGVVELLDLLDKLGLPRAICTSSRHEDVRTISPSADLSADSIVIAQGDYAAASRIPRRF